MKGRQWFTALVMIVVTAAAAFAQVQSGSITGTVVDEQGGVLPGVTITLQGDGPPRTFVTEPGGLYRFINVPPGTYRLEASLQGFRPFIREGLSWPSVRACSCR